MWGFIKKIFGSDNDKQTNDPTYQSLLKKYDIEPVDWAGTDTPEDKVRKAKKEKERQIKHRQEKSKKEDRQKEKERQIKHQQEKTKKEARQKELLIFRRSELIEKYGEELGTKIAKGELWIGMNKEALIAIKGKPGKKTETISRNKKREEYFYDGKKNRQGNISYKLKIILINGLVEKWALL
tara:strand:+ start:116 stop:661 length:546 start_codon:yes stop_codon:yes gene_type:complete